MPKKLDILSPRPDKKHQECYKKIFFQKQMSKYLRLHEKTTNHIESQENTTFL